MFVDVSQQESAVSLIGADVLAYQMTGQEPERRGNRAPYFAPHNSYLCAGEDRWVAIAAPTDEEWRQLAHQVGGPDLADDSRFSTVKDRMEHENQLDELISGWTVDKKAYDICHLLQKQGVPASPVMGGPDLLTDPHYEARGTFVHINHERVGEKAYPGIPWKMSETPGQVRWPSPTLGQHNRQIYGDLLGIPAEDIDALETLSLIHI